MFYMLSEGKDCVVISDDGHCVNYTSRRNEVKHEHLLSNQRLVFCFAFRTFSVLCCVFHKEEKTFSFDQVVTVDTIQVQKSF